MKNAKQNEIKLPILFKYVKKMKVKKNDFNHFYYNEFTSSFDKIVPPNRKVSKIV